MSWTLGVDTSSSTLSLGLIQNDVPVIATSRYVKNSHSEHISKVIENFLSLAEITVHDIEKCVVVTGPGSFTGLRIGISFIKGLFANTGTPVLALSSLENMAGAYPLKNGSLYSVIDARQDFVFCAPFTWNNGVLTRTAEDEKIEIETLISRLSEDDTILFDTAGNMRSTLPEVFKEFNALPFDSLNLQTGLAAALRGLDHPNSEEWNEAINIFPNYMQESYAERTRKQ